MDHTNSLKGKLEEINTILTERYNEDTEIGVLAGISGIALFHFYYSKFKESEINYDLGAEILSEIINRINAGYNTATFCSGIAGAGWALMHLEEEFIEIDSDELLCGLDEYLYAIMLSDLEKGYYDFLHGGIGYGIYFLKRYENTKSKTLKKRYKDYLLEHIALLNKASKKDNKGLKWESILNFDRGNRGYNLSLSHGISSIINFLARLHYHKDFKENVRPVLNGAVDYIIEHQSQKFERTSLFPSWIETNKKNNENSRLAWCYGDLGVGISLWHASKSMNDAELKEKALEILKHSSRRKDLNEANVMDAGLCHGAYGIAQIYNRIYSETKEELFKETSDYWIDKAVEMATQNDDFAGYKQWRGDSNEWKGELNLLEGIAGIGLAIISNLADFDTKWDECLMIS